MRASCRPWLSLILIINSGRASPCPLKKIVMDKKYHDFLSDIIKEMGSRYMTVNFYRSLFDRIYYVSFYYRQFIASSTPEEESLARWSLGDARDELEHIMQVLCFDDSLKEKIRYIAKSRLSSVSL